MRPSRALMAAKKFVGRSTPASYYRGGTSRALIFHQKDIPSSSEVRDTMFLQAIGAPDPHGRQLNGMGAGISSLSKICVIGDGRQYGADVTYTFVGIGIERDEVDFTGNCGNMSSAVGPFAYDQKILKPTDPSFYEKEGEVTVNIFNTNTKKMIRNTFAVADGQARIDDQTSIDGVSGLGTGVMLEFLHPGGSKTGKLLPTGNVVDKILGFEVSCVDAANPGVFVRAADVGIEPTILPAKLSEDSAARQLLERIRAAAAVKMGICKSEAEVPRVIPKIALVSPRQEQKTLAGTVTPASELDIVVRFISDGQPHRAIPLTGALCTACAAKVPGSVVQKALPESATQDGVITIGHPSGRIQVDAKLDESNQIESASVVRTARRIMEGNVFWSEETEPQTR